tara:strand:+ start:369 stop:512 length:144 start_codon:yes stop_codon:yes gene_type:complete
MKQEAIQAVEKLFEITEFLNEDGDLGDMGYDRIIDALSIVESELFKI